MAQKDTMKDNTLSFEERVAMLKNANKETTNEQVNNEPSFTESTDKPETENIEEKKPVKENRFAMEVKKELAEDVTKREPEIEKPSEAKEKPVSESKKPVTKDKKAARKREKKPSTQNFHDFSVKKLVEEIKENDVARYVAMAICFGLVALCAYGMLINVMHGEVRANPLANLAAVFQTKGSFKLIFILFFAALVILLIAMIGRNKKNGEDERNIKFADSDQYGSSGWMSKEDRKKCLEIKSSVEETEGIILGKEKKTGKIVSLPHDSDLNRNIFICGNQGTMKSWGYARNLIMQLSKKGESIVVSDMKGELYRDTAKYLEEKGYIVKQFNLKDHMASDSWNCLGDLTIDDIPIFCDTVIRNTMEKGKDWDSFYDGNALNLLKALVFYIKLDKDLPEDEKTLASAYDLLLSSLELQELDNKFAALERKHPGRMAYSLFKSEKIKENTISSLGTRLQILQNKKIQEIVSNTDIELSLPAKKKCAYFIIKSDQEETYDMLGTLFITYLFIKNVEYADGKREMKTDVPIHFILDEFAQLGTIMSFKKKFATVRSRGIGISLLVQNIPQMYDRYTENETAEYIGGCDTIVFLGGNDPITKKFFSDMTGDITITVDTVKKNLNTIRLTDWTPGYSESEGFGKRMLLNPDEVGRLKADHTSLIFISGYRPLMVDKFGFHENPVYKSWGGKIEEHQKHPAEHIPIWIKELKEKTNFQAETGGLYNLKPFPEYFETRFEDWRNEYYNNLEKTNPSFDRRKKKITLNDKKQLITEIEKLNIEQGEDIYEYIRLTLEHGLVDINEYEAHYKSRLAKEERLEKLKMKLIMDAKTSAAETNKNNDEDNEKKTVVYNSTSTDKETDSATKTANEQKKEKIQISIPASVKSVKMEHIPNEANSKPPKESSFTADTANDTTTNEEIDNSKLNAAIDSIRNLNIGNKEKAAEQQKPSSLPSEAKKDDKEEKNKSYNADDIFNMIRRS